MPHPDGWHDEKRLLAVSEARNVVVTRESHSFDVVTDATVKRLLQSRGCENCVTRGTGEPACVAVCVCCARLDDDDVLVTDMAAVPTDQPG